MPSTVNSNRFSPVRKAPPRPEPEDAPQSAWDYQDLHLPARLVMLLHRHKITASDLLLFSVIKVLTKHHGDGSGRGCYATNKRLAAWVGRDHRHVSARLNELAAMGLVLLFDVGGVRYVELEWDRTVEERAALAGAYGRACRKAHKEAAVRLSGEATPPTENSVAPPTEKSVGANLIISRELDGGAAAPHGPPSKAPQNSHAKPRRLPSPPLLVQDQAVADAKAFRAALHAGGVHVSDTVKGCADNLRRLFAADGTARRVFLWFKDRCGRQDVKRFGLPKITSGVQFCKRFEWVRDQYEKHAGPLDRDDDLEDAQYQPDYILKEPVPGRPGHFTRRINPKYLKRRPS